MLLKEGKEGKGEREKVLFETQLADGEAFALNTEVAAIIRR